MTEDSDDISQLACIEALIDNVGGSEEVARLVVDEFLSQMPGQLQAVGQAIAANDCGLVAACAHKLQGSFSAIFALSAASCAGDVERAARRKELVPVRTQYQALCQHAHELARRLEHWRARSSNTAIHAGSEHD